MSLTGELIKRIWWEIRPEVWSQKSGRCVRVCVRVRDFGGAEVLAQSKRK